MFLSVKKVLKLISVFIVFLIIFFISNNNITVTETHFNIILTSEPRLNKSKDIISTVITERCVVDMRRLKSDLNVQQITNSWADIEKKLWALNITEGEWSPNCISDQKVAIIIPYRDRLNHLKTFINHMHSFLHKQMLSYGIFVIEQAPNRVFNKAALMNIGFLEAAKLNYTCFIFHDVDMLPIDERNMYKCVSTPLHLAAAVDKFQFRLIYEYLVGGAIAMTKEQFTNINGYSNLYFGWGAEDDDLAARLDGVGYKISRNSVKIARYKMISHSEDKGNPRNHERYKLVISARTRFKYDGLNSLMYIPISTYSETKLFRRIIVQFSKCEILKKWRKLYNLPDDD